jgi:methylmalonyl-CoA mutase N-terminal domain/subunit
VNRYRIEEEQRQVELHRYRPELADESIRRTAEVVAGRDSATAAEALQNVRRAAVEGHNLVPSMMDAVRAYVTLGEITHVLKEIFGTFREPVAL